MPEQNTLFRYQRFAKQVSSESRYFWSEEVQTFLTDIKETMKNRVATVTENKPLWRARIGCEWLPVYAQGIHIDDEPEPFDATNLMPLLDKATEGRANPKGIPVLYVAGDRKTAVSEVRPWVGAQVSVAQLQPTKELKIIDCAKYHDKQRTKLYLDEDPSRDEEIEEIWTSIDKAFARPTTPNDKTADYVPTQILTELFRSEGYDGIGFKSSVSDQGYNLAIFDPENVDIKYRQVVEIKKIHIGCEWSGGSRLRTLDAG